LPWPNPRGPCLPRSPRPAHGGETCPCAVAAGMGANTQAVWWPCGHPPSVA